MAYIGNNLQVAFPSYTNIDDISGSFNGVTKSFPLTVSGSTPVPFPINSQQCLISVNGVIQRPDDSGTEGFKLSGPNIVFSSAPTAGWDFFGIILAGADYINVGVNYPAGSVSVPSITFTNDLDTGIYNYATNQLGITCGGTLSTFFTANGQSFKAGSAGSPGLFVENDTNTGIYSPGADQVSITTGGIERLRIDAAGQVEAVSLGTAAAPTYSFTTDPNTGIYSPGADQLALATNGSGRLFVDSSGRVGVGTNTFAAVNHALTVAGGYSVLNGLRISGADTANSIYQAAAFGLSSDNYITFGTGGSQAERLRITSAGLVGVGTSSPGYTLDVSGAGRHFSTTTDSASLYLSKTNSGTADQGGNKIYFTNTGPAATARASGTLIGALQFQASQPTSGSLQNCGAIEITADGTQAGIYTPTKIQFSTANTINSGSNVVAMTIDSSQRVGIGTTSPVFGVGDGLEVARSGVSTIRVSSSTQGVELRSDAGTGTLETRGSFPLLLGTGGTERARIDSSGRLLVGTSSARSNFFNESYGTRLQIEATGSSASASITTNTANAAEAAYFVLARANGASVGSTTVVAADNRLGVYSFQGSDGTEFVEAASIAAFVDGTPGANDMPGRLVFSTTADGASSPTEAMRINNGQELLIGYTTDNGAYKLQVNSQIFATSAIIATSDGRYKENVATLEGCVDLVKALRPVSFDWKLQKDITRIDDKGNEILVREGHNFPDGTQVGFIAQEVQEVLADKPWLSSVIKQNVRPAVKDNDGNELAPEEEFLGIAEGNLIAVLTSALQEAIGEIESLKARVAALESA